jgi:HlyD family secretion protein
MVARFIRYALPLAAVAGIVFAIVYVLRPSQSASESGAASNSIRPPATPFVDTLAGAGVVEPQSENISIGSPLPGIVAEVPVEVGQKVKQGDLLFRMDDRQLRSELASRQAALAIAQAELIRLQNEPRPENVAVTAAQVKEAEAVEIEAKLQLDRIANLRASNAVTPAELDAAERTAAVAVAQLARARAELDLLQAGAWYLDEAVAQQQIEQARAEVERVQTELDRLEIRAPRDGEVLQVNVRPGEYAGTPPGATLLVLGSTDSLHVRIDIDEQDIGRYRIGIPGVAMPRGFPDLKYDLKFKRVEPFVVPKRSLTGDNTERVDTRVLQVIYEVVKNQPPLYVGQQLDVFFELPHTKNENITTPPVESSATAR